MVGKGQDGDVAEEGFFSKRSSINGWKLERCLLWPQKHCG